jgi:hypothetical protein
MTDDIALLLCKMMVGHGRLLSGSDLVMLFRIPETLSCPILSLCGAL